MAPARVLAEHGGAEIPARVAIPRELGAVEAGTQRGRGEDGLVVDRRIGLESLGDHARASGGRYGICELAARRASATTSSEKAGSTWPTMRACARPNLSCQSLAERPARSPSMNDRKASMAGSLRAVITALEQSRVRRRRKKGRFVMN